MYSSNIRCNARRLFHPTGLSTLRYTPRDGQRMTRGQDGSLLLPCVLIRLSPPIPHQWCFWSAKLGASHFRRPKDVRIGGAGVQIGHIVGCAAWWGRQPDKHASLYWTFTNYHWPVCAGAHPIDFYCLDRAYPVCAQDHAATGFSDSLPRSAKIIHKHLLQNGLDITYE